MKDKTTVRNLIAGTLLALSTALSVPSAAVAEPGCRNGASPLGHAYVRANPLYALYFGDVETYVTNNSQYYLADADAIRCARALSGALMAGAIQAYDPADLERQREIGARLGAMGISPGAQQPSPATQLYMMGQNMARLARVLPPAAMGNYTPLRTPTTELEKMQMFAGQMLRSMIDRPTLELIRPHVEEAAQLEYKIITGLAANLAVQ